MWHGKQLYIPKPITAGVDSALPPRVSYTFRLKPLCNSTATRTEGGSKRGLL